MEDEKRKKFLNLAKQRTNNVLNSIRILGNLSSNTYKYEQDDIDKIFTAITESLEETKDKFKPKKMAERKSFSFDDTDEEVDVNLV